MVFDDRTRRMKSVPGKEIMMMMGQSWALPTPLSYWVAGS